MSAGGIKKKDTDIDGDFFAILCTATKLILIHSTISCFFLRFCGTQDVHRSAFSAALIESTECTHSKMITLVIYYAMSCDY